MNIYIALQYCLMDDKAFAWKSVTDLALLKSRIGKAIPKGDKKWEKGKLYIHWFEQRYVWTYEDVSIYFCQFFENWRSMRISNEIELYKSGEKIIAFVANN